MVNVDQYKRISEELMKQHVTLVAVSKTKPVEDIQALYNLGQRDFGENYVQELADKQAVLPKDIRWHFIGHLQSNKVKYIAPFVHLIHGVDSWKLLKEINKQGDKQDRVIDCLLQAYIAQEETKFGMDRTEIAEIMPKLAEHTNVRVKGLMGMASFTLDQTKIHEEFRNLKALFNEFSPVDQPWSTLSMGMSGDYTIAVEEGSTMVRIGSLLFGSRD
jgi:pyridoxal phosphate enzyme (YggS family)